MGEVVLKVTLDRLFMAVITKLYHSKIFLFLWVMAKAKKIHGLFRFSFAVDRVVDVNSHRITIYP